MGEYPWSVRAWSGAVLIRLVLELAEIILGPCPGLSGAGRARVRKPGPYV